jgi:predicted GNAT family N-acyltransferase
MVKSCYVDYEHRAIADICEFDGIGQVITRINVPISSRGQGVARRLLAQILKDADESKTTLFLEISPSDGLSFEQLKAWYARHGFERWKGLYRRLPR